MENIEHNESNKNVKENKKLSSNSTLSKKRYDEIKERLSAVYGTEHIDNVMFIIRDIMNFDPSISMYTPEKGKKDIEWRKKKAQEQGITTYMICGKNYYEKKKQMKKEKSMIDEKK